MILSYICLTNNICLHTLFNVGKRSVYVRIFFWSSDIVVPPLYFYKSFSLFISGMFIFVSSVTLASLRRSCCILEGLRGTPRINLLGQWLLRFRKFNHIRDFWLQQQQSLHLPLFPFAQQPIQAWSTDNQRPSYHVHNFNVYLDVSNKVLTLGYLVLEKL